MRLLAKFLCLGLTLLCVSSCNKDKNLKCLPNGLTNAVIAFYPFPNGSIEDLSGNGHHLINNTTASASTDRFGNQNCAFSFVKANDEFLTGSNSTFLNNRDEFSISLWCQPIDPTRGTGLQETLVSRGDERSCADRRGDWSLTLYDCRRANFSRLANVWDTWLTNGCQDEIDTRTGVWHHYVATQSSNGDIHLYRDGVLQEAGTGISNCSTPPTIQDVGDLLLGKNYTGGLDDVIIFDRPVVQQEVSDLFAMEECCSL